MRRSLFPLVAFAFLFLLNSCAIRVTYHFENRSSSTVTVEVETSDGRSTFTLNPGDSHDVDTTIVTDYYGREGGDIAWKYSAPDTVCYAKDRYNIIFYDKLGGLIAPPH
ncbi:MAG TPA: hypothetical protein VMU36_14330 [Spirochaetia bacterium]|nr:hypothetical protein [Spirochaetia bacterium]